MSEHFIGEDSFQENILRFSNKSWLRTNADPMQKDKANVVAEIPGTLLDYPDNVVVKNFGWRNTLSIIFSPVMRSRAKKSWDMALWLLEHNVATPEPLAPRGGPQPGLVDAFNWGARSDFKAKIGCK